MSKDIETIEGVLNNYGAEAQRDAHRGYCYDPKEAIQQIEKIIKERVIGEDEPGVTNVMIVMERARQRQALTNALYGKGEIE